MIRYVVDYPLVEEGTIVVKIVLCEIDVHFESR
jgi:hypothetical protein